MRKALSILLILLLSCVPPKAQREPYQETAVEAVQSWAYNHSATIWDVPDSLWSRLEAQAELMGMTVDSLACQIAPHECERED